jgi:hypothetical protein
LLGLLTFEILEKYTRKVKTVFGGASVSHVGSPIKKALVCIEQICRRPRCKKASRTTKNHGVAYAININISTTNNSSGPPSKKSSIFLTLDGGLAREIV